MGTAIFLTVKVYVVGFYLESKSSDAKAIIAFNQTKRIYIVRCLSRGAMESRFTC